MVESTQNVRCYVDISTNVNDIIKFSISEDAHGLPIDLIKLICEVQQVRNISTTMQNASSFVNLHNILIPVNLLSLSHLLVIRIKGK